MRCRAQLLSLLLGLVPLSCNAIWGIDELSYDGAGASQPAGGAGGLGGDGGPGGHTPTGGGGTGTGVVQGHVWSMSLGDDASQQIRAVAVGPDDSIVLAGEYAGTMTFGATELTSSDQADIFLAKLDADGDPSWALTGSGSGQQLVRGAAIGPAGSVFVVGYFYQSLTIDTETVTGNDEPNLFIAKLGSAGNVSWTSSQNVPGAQRAADVAMIGGGHIVVTGDFQNDISFGGPVLQGTGGDDDVFLARLDNDGVHVWSLSIPGASEQRAFGVAVDEMDNVYVTGHLEGTMEFPSDPQTSAGEPDVYVAKFDSAGAYVWSRRYGDALAQGGQRIAVDSEGSVWIAGTFGGSLDLDGQVLTALSAEDVFLAKLDRDGNVLHARSCSGPAKQTAYGLAVDAQQAAVLAGGCAGAVDCGHGPLSGAGLEDVLLVRVGPTGALLGTDRYGDALDQHGRALAFDSAGRLVLTGNFWGTLELAGTTLQSAGAWDVFVAKLEL